MGAKVGAKWLGHSGWHNLCFRTDILHQSGWGKLPELALGAAIAANEACGNEVLSSGN